MKVEFSQRFLKESKYLGKRYQNFDDDLEEFVNNLEVGKIRSDRVQGFRLPIYKARVRNSSSNSGKSGGFRVVYYSMIPDGAYLLAIYSKNQKEDISKKEILVILKKEKKLRKKFAKRFQK